MNEPLNPLHTELRLNLAGILTWARLAWTVWDLQSMFHILPLNSLPQISAARLRPFGYSFPPKSQNPPAKFKRRFLCGLAQTWTSSFGFSIGTESVRSVGKITLALGILHVPQFACILECFYSCTVTTTVCFNLAHSLKIFFDKMLLQATCTYFSISLVAVTRSKLRALEITNNFAISHLFPN